MGVGIVVPPFDIQFWPETQLLPALTVFDPDWVTTIILGRADWIKGLAQTAIEATMPTIIEATFKAVEPHLDKLTEDFYRRHGV